MPSARCYRCHRQRTRATALKSPIVGTRSKSPTSAANQDCAPRRSSVWPTGRRRCSVCANSSASCAMGRWSSWCDDCLYLAAGDARTGVDIPHSSSVCPLLFAIHDGASTTGAQNEPRMPADLKGCQRPHSLAASGSTSIANVRYQRAASPRHFDPTEWSPPLRYRAWPLGDSFRSPTRARATSSTSV